MFTSTTTAVIKKKRCRSKMPDNGVHDQQLVSRWWLQSISLQQFDIVDSKLTLICLLTQQQLVTASARNTQDIILI